MDHLLVNQPVCQQLDKFVVYAAAARKRKKSKQLAAQDAPVMYICDNCGKPFYKRRKHKRNKKFYCSVKCAAEAHRVVRERPSKEELQRLVWSVPTSELSKRFGVSDVAIAKWCKKYSISKPPRGYWAKVKSAKERLGAESLKEG